MDDTGFQKIKQVYKSNQNTIQEKKIEFELNKYDENQTTENDQDFLK